MMETTAYNRLLTTMRSGTELTAKQIAARFRISQPYHLIYRLRENGFQIELVERTNSKGQSKNFYRLIEKTKRRTKAA
jgi:hypothetical protein